MRAVGDVGCLEHLLHVRLGLDAHVLLAEGLGLLLEVRILLSSVSESWRHGELGRAHELLRERHLLELQAVLAGSGGAQQRTRREEDGRLHGDGKKWKRQDCGDKKPMQREDGRRWVA